MGHGPDKEIGLFEAIGTLRAMRHLRPDPVPEEAIRAILEAATKAPSGKNRQPWMFLVVRDREAKRRIADYYVKAFDRSMGATPSTDLPPDQLRIWWSARYLAEHMGDAPVLILACLSPMSGVRPDPAARYASIYPAVQNLMLAARALGLGTTLTTMHRVHEQEIKSLLGIPEDVETVALIPVGYPEGKFGPAPRRPVEEVTYYDRWGRSKPRSQA